MVFRFRLDSLAKIDGFIAGCLFDRESGVLLGLLPTDKAPALERAASSWKALLQAQREAGEAMGSTGQIEELVVRQPDQIHLLRPLVGQKGLCFALVLDRRRAEGDAKLALAWLELAEAEEALL